MIVLALLFAVALNDRKLRGRGFFRTAIFLPCVTSLVAYSVLFKSMFAVRWRRQPAFSALHIIGQPDPWLGDPFWAKVVIILAITWRWTGYNMIFYLAALQNIDRSIYEAARIDGVPRLGALLSHHHADAEAGDPVHHGHLDHRHAAALRRGQQHHRTGRPGEFNADPVALHLQPDLQFMPSFGYAATVSYVIVVLVGILSFIQFLVARDRRRP